MVRLSAIGCGIWCLATIGCGQSSPPAPSAPVIDAPVASVTPSAAPRAATSASPAAKPEAAVASADAGVEEGEPGYGLGSHPGAGQGFGRLSSNTGITPILRPGQITVSGRLPPEVIQRIVRQNYGRFRLCYENGLKIDPKLEGRVTVRFTIDASGVVKDERDGGSTLPEPGTVACVVRAFANLTFPQPEKGEVIVNYPILFAPGS